MIRCCRIAILAIATVFTALAVPAAAAPALGGGGTTATVDGTTVTITVHIDLCCIPEDAAQRDIWVPLVRADIKAAQDMWNEALAKLTAKGCFDVRVVFDARFLNTAKDPWDPGYHQIILHFTGGGTSGSHWPGDIPQTADSDYEYTHTLPGDFWTDIEVKTWAHEIGHLMGLGDDYRNGLNLRFEGYGGYRDQRQPCLSGRGGTLMCDGNTIDQALADRLVANLSQFGLLPQCWKGTLKAHGQGNVYNDDAIVELRFSVADDGTVKGSGHARMSSAPQTMGNTVQTHTVTPSEFDFPLSGSLVGDEFHLMIPSDLRSTMVFTAKSSTSSASPPIQTQAFPGVASEGFFHPRVRAEDGATNTFHSTGPAAIEVTGSIVIHRAEN
jgi:hypothetical protein